MKPWELTIYRDGTALLTDEEGELVWSADSDDDFAGEFPDVLTIEDGDAIADYLEDNEIVPHDIALDIVEADATGLHEILDSEDGEIDEDAEDTLQ